MTDSFPFRDASALADAYRLQHCTPAEVVQDALERAGAAPHVFISLTADRALREAAASSARWRAGQPLSVLDGVPVAWKDLYDVAGHVTTAGAALRRDSAPAERDAPLVTQASRAGMICLGKTNLSEFAYSGLGLNPHFGTPTNPFDTHEPRIPGGSSSGSAVAVATGLAPLAMGTDTAGSIRVPAAFNGLVGYRASAHRYCHDRVFPLARSLDTMGPFARSVRDVIAFDALLRGQIGHELGTVSLSGRRFLVDEGILADSRIEPAVRVNFESTIKALVAAGGIIERREATVFQDILDLIAQHGWLGGAEAFALHEALLNTSAAEELDPRVRTRLESARELRASTLLHLQEARIRLKDAMRTMLDGAFLITPTVGHVAPPLAPLEQDTERFFATNSATLRLTMPGSLLDMPGIAMPSGYDTQGLPTSVLIAAPSGEDECLLRTALACERALQH
ncbi:amidase [Phytohalomonas tamaricis]|uniref:amidase n=1 Tax=Phytohalomonas tamaricis TaxID=2081032 RepID=UPI0021D3FB4E|nr:amidase [Phytohalomonas tamaricis]